MSCACENSRRSREYDRIFRLAKALAQMEDKTVAVFRNDDGTYGFVTTGALKGENKEITEYVTPY